ncbi:MAG TPA: beta-ketoacyl synthase chain length factor [Dokdonella sp.]|uniref:beta-ketoacyl synthase chain length factor n=1 Tax=Dokdonella sp. TaxID=2291710 RepID=UPI002BD34C2C|nr:beta-ketoacyl synthase chain length factor [Dokdonella sp.]HUD41419.1 beta-ketoacyl synthase chain length factor [Dokdonella sp.]
MTPRLQVSHLATWPDDLTGSPAAGGGADAPLPTLSAMAPMMRRRVEPLGRMALHVAYASQGQDTPLPVVFASRYGDVPRSIALLRQLVDGQTPSPTAFSLSVHNAIGALWSIANGHTAPYTAIAAGEETVEAAFTEAIGLLVDGAPAVMVVCYDEPLPVPYDVYADHPDMPHAWACRLRLSDGAGISLSALPAAADASAPQAGAAADTPAPDLTADRRVLGFLRSDAPGLDHRAGARLWQWRRHA